MIIIIDGYNLLKQIFPGQKNTLAKHRDYFIRQLATYKVHRENSIKEIVVVFDAGPSNHATRSVKSGIVVVYSGTQSSADEWIIEFIARKKGNELLLVTLDRALREKGQKLGVDWISVHDFYRLMVDSLPTPQQPTASAWQSSLEKYETNYADDLDDVHVDPSTLYLFI